MTKTTSKIPYSAPKLKAFGSARNLTGGSGDQGSESGGGMTMMAMSNV